MSVADEDGIDDSIASADLGLSSTCPIEGATGSVPLLPPSSLKPKSLSSAFLTRFGRAFLVKSFSTFPKPESAGLRARQVEKYSDRLASSLRIVEVPRWVAITIL